MRVVHAPVRVGDVGGWTDTWFARHGSVFSIAVEPGVLVSVEPIDRDGIELVTPDVGAGPQPLVSAAVEEAGATGIRLEVRAAVPPGAATGTSAAVVVAVLAALQPSWSPAELACRAHRVETVRLGLQSGVQDQVAAAYGGVNLIEVDYPETTVRPLGVDPAWLDAHLVVAYLGRPHASSAVHEQVIARLEADGHASPLERLRAAAGAAARAAVAADLDALAATMVDATEAQRDLHPALVSVQAQALIDVAAAAGAAGWKVNGAGGQGGSLTFLAHDRAAVVDAIASAPGSHQVLDLRVAVSGARSA